MALDLRAMLEERAGASGGAAPAEEMPQGGDPLTDAMADLLAAFEAKDPQAMGDAFHAAMQACEMMPAEAGEEAPAEE